ncbi:MAG: hypothetical protein LUE99_07045 [Bacteroides sp.]|nr:hypothetical protein [Bacteroides sp.]
MYLPKDPQGLINMEIALCSDADGANVIKTTSVPYVPLKANHRTNIIGDFDVAMNIFSISCDATWENSDLVPEEPEEPLVSPSVWDGTKPEANDAYTFKGDGTEEKPYEIRTATDLAQFAANVNAGTSYSGKYFKLLVDIDLDNQDWDPIGGKTSSVAFEGNFDGNHKQITNLKVEKVTGKV